MSVKHVHKRPNPRHFRLKTKGGYINDVVLTYAKAAISSWSAGLVVSNPRHTHSGLPVTAYRYIDIGKYTSLSVAAM